jgi:hypothetical protein
MNNRVTRVKLLNKIREEDAMATIDEPTVDGAVRVQVAADVGNARTVVLVKSPAGVASVKMPTVKSTIGLTLPEKLGKDDYVITRKRGGAQVPIALGWTALRYADGASAARGHSDRYGAWTLDYILAAVARATKATKIDAQLRVCVPAVDFVTVESTVVRAMWATHSYGAPDLQVTTRFSKVDVVKEGEVAFRALRARTDGNVIVIDGGGGTTHVALYRGGVLIDVVTRPIGVQRVLDAASKAVVKKFGRELTMLERYELEDALADERHPAYKIVVNGREERVDDIARGFLDETASVLINDVKAIVPKWRNAHAVHLGGGVAYTMGAHFAGKVHGEEGFPGIVIAQRPDELNARGALALFGQDVETIEEVA